MKFLPDNPSLDHLRQQAKDHLCGLRDSDPSVSLTTAQANLAAQYGFRSWADLKDEVDRLQDSADIADLGMSHEVATRFGLGTVIGDMRSVARADHLGRLWSMQTDRGRWAVRIGDTWTPLVDPEREVALQEAAAVLSPRPIRSRDGAIVEPVDGHSCRVWQWLHSGPPLSAPASSVVTRRVGEILAGIHRLALPADGVSPWAARRFSDSPWNEVAATAQAKGVAWADALVQAAPTLAGLEAAVHAATIPEAVLTHHSLIPGNVRRGGQGRLIVAGWEHAGGLPPAWELCDALIAWAVDPAGGVNSTGARALVAGYRSVAGRLPELDLGTFRGAITGLGNYVCGQVELALSSEDPFLERNVHHLLAHLPTVSTLERLLLLASGPDVADGDPDDGYPEDQPDQ